jgi:hypothetical protein
MQHNGTAISLACAIMLTKVFLSLALSLSLSLWISYSDYRSNTGMRKLLQQLCDKAGVGLLHFLLNTDLKLYEIKCVWDQGKVSRSVIVAIVSICVADDVALDWYISFMEKVRCIIGYSDPTDVHHHRWRYAGMNATRENIIVRNLKSTLVFCLTICWLLATSSRAVEDVYKVGGSL